VRDARQTALLFPGQGAHALTMLDGLRDCPSFGERHAYIVARLGFDPLRRPDAARLIDTNQVSSLFTVLASSLSLDLLRAQGTCPTALAGYSVGQWTALYAAGVVSFEQLVDIVHARASFMDECFAGRQGAMLAVIGLSLPAVEEVCQGLQSAGWFLAVSNHNCIGQLSLSGDLAAVELAIPRLAAMQPKKIQRLPVAGAWHCALLAEAERRFLAFLEDLPLGRPSLPVCDNVSGGFLPEDGQQMKRQLARQVAAPVQWEQCMQTLLRAGCNEFIETGFGKVLTSFGFFINRKVLHRSFHDRGSSG
jgi:[acyl-carrier-protein] S-malonyltransferase